MARENLTMPLEVETRLLEEVEELMALVEGGGAPSVTRIMLDNMAKADTSRPGAPVLGLEKCRPTTVVAGMRRLFCSGSSAMKKIAAT